MFMDLFTANIIYCLEKPTSNECLNKNLVKYFKKLKKNNKKVCYFRHIHSHLIRTISLFLT